MLLTLAIFFTAGCLATSERNPLIVSSIFSFLSGSLSFLGLASGVLRLFRLFGLFCSFFLDGDGVALILIDLFEITGDGDWCMLSNATGNSSDWKSSCKKTNRVMKEQNIYFQVINMNYNFCLPI